MLYHIGNHRDYWFCRSCWQKMPDFGEVKNSRSIRQEKTVNLSTSLHRLTKPALVSPMIVKVAPLIKTASRSAISY